MLRYIVCVLFAFISFAYADTPPPTSILGLKAGLCTGGVVQGAASGNVTCSSSTANSLGYFNNSSLFSSSPNFRLNDGSGWLIISTLSNGANAGDIGSASTGASLVVGHVDGVSSIVSTAFGKGNVAFGYAGAGSQVSAQGDGSLVAGKAVSQGIVATEHDASFGFGYASGLGSQVSANGLGTWSIGYADGGAIIGAVGPGNHTWGYASGAGSEIATDIASFGSEAIGYVTGGGVLDTTGSGAMSMGYADGAASISGQGGGAMAVGRSTAGGNIQAQGDGALAHGFASGGTIVGSGSGSFASGRSEVAGASVLASAFGSAALGYADGFHLESTANGALALGVAQNAKITASGQGSIAGGFPLAGQVVVNGVSAIGIGDAITGAARLSTTFGLGNDNESYASLMIGRYGTTAGSTNTSWVSTDPVFVIGNGASSGSLANAMTVLKSGRVGIGTATPGHLFDVLGDGYVGGDLYLDGAVGSGHVHALGYNIGTFHGDFTNSTTTDGTNDFLRWSHSTITSMNFTIGSDNSVSIHGILSLPVQAAATTPSCSADGLIAITHSHIMCVCNGSTWVKVADGSTSCTF